jgi:hypothetical protein
MEAKETCISSNQKEGFRQSEGIHGDGTVFPAFLVKVQSEYTV